jgi:hypothetical protein
MSQDRPVPDDTQTGEQGPRVNRPLDVIVCVDGLSKGLLRRVRRLLRQCTGETRLILVDGGRIDALLWSRLQGLAREARALLLLRHHGAGGPSSIELAMAHSAGRDVLLLGADVQVFPRLVAHLARALGEHDRAGIISPVSNRRPLAENPSWASSLPAPRGVSPKRWAKLIQRVAPKSRPELVAPDAACMLLRRELLDVIGPPPGSGDATALVRYSDAARKHGFRVHLADDVYVHHATEPELPSGDGRSVPDRDPPHALAQLLSWHERRGTAKNRTAPLITLDGSPFSVAADDVDQPVPVRAMIERLSLPRAVLAYPAVGGIELAEILDGRWHEPLLYKRELKLPLAASVEDTSEAREAASELIELFQIGFVHLLGDTLWRGVLGPALSGGLVPYCVSVTDEIDGAETSLLVPARAVLCPSESARAELCQRFALKEKRVHAETRASNGAGAGAGPPGADALLAWTAAYDACRARAKSRAPWLSREQLQQLRALYRGSAPLTLPPAQHTEAPAPHGEGWVQRIGRRAPDVLRSAWKRLPYPAKQQRKPR